MRPDEGITEVAGAQKEGQGKLIRRDSGAARKHLVGAGRKVTLPQRDLLECLDIAQSDNGAPEVARGCCEHSHLPPKKIRAGSLGQRRQLQIAM